MKIACITSSLIPSSTANSIQVMKVGDAMLGLGEQVCVWAPGGYQVDPQRIREQYGLDQEAIIRWVPSVRRLKRYDFALRTLHAARRWGADLVYTWLPQVAVGAQVLGLPVVLEMHDRATGRFGLFWLRRFLSGSGPKHLVVISHALQAALEQQTGLRFPDALVTVAPNGVDLGRYQDLPAPAAARKQLGLEESFTLGYTGHFYAGRGVGILFHLAKTFPSLQHLWVGGREEELIGVRTELDRASLRNVHLTGFVDNHRLPLYQSACEVLLMPYGRTIAGSSGGNSADICSPMKMFEYMASGRAILTSDLPVIREVLDDRSAQFCTPEDPRSWEEAVRSLLDAPARRQSLAERSLALAQDLTLARRQQRILRAVADAG